MASALALLDANHNLLLSRTFSHSIVPIPDLLATFKTLTHKTPVIHHLGINYIYITTGELVILAISYYEHVNVMTIMSFLYKFKDILESYFKRLDREVVVDNYGLVYELIDEIVDYGVVQVTDVSVLGDVIKLEVNDGGNESEDVNSSILRSTTSAVSWRPRGIFYKKNELFVDVLERVSLIVDGELKITKHLVEGSILVKSYLSGMPQVQIELSKIYGLQFNQCVDLQKFNEEKVIQFIPPDGAFTLCSYSLSIKALPVIQITTHDFTLSGDRVRLKIGIKTNFKTSAVMKDLIIRIPIDLEKYDVDFAMTPKHKTRIGKVFYKFDENSVVWKIDAIGGDREFTMDALLLLKTGVVPVVEMTMDPPPKKKTNFNKIHQLIESAARNKDIHISFNVPDQTLSELKVDYLNIVDSLDYTSFPWVRYKIVSGDYVYRLTS